MGHYIPYLNETALWELETDYYLHNFHSRSGKGTLCSMNSFRRTFGIDAIHRKMEETHRSDGSSRVVQVRQQVEAQSEALSVWWKVALQSNLQQRMWMKLGQLAPAESLLPPKYERLYQPDKIAQFDRFFARGWATPLRRSHSAQHVDETAADSEGSALTRALTRRPKVPYPVDEVPDVRTLSDIQTPSELDATRLSGLVAYYDKQNQFTSKHEFLGEICLSDSRVPQEYIEYCSSPEINIPPTHRKRAVAEFKLRLHDCSLDPDDVNGIRKLAESAHINQTIRTGPYRGLHSDCSAVQVETAIHEQFIGIERSSASSKKVIEAELKRRGLDTLGVTESIDVCWSRFCASEKQYIEITETPLSESGKSDLTTPSAYNLYASYFDHATPLTSPDLIFLSGESVANSKTPSSNRLEPEKASSFVKKASRLGIAVKSHENEEVPSKSSLFPLDVRKHVPSGFEQINDDLFCRKSNKFFVLNGAAVDTWDGIQPMTKSLHLQDLYLSDARSV